MIPTIEPIKSEADARRRLEAVKRDLSDFFSGGGINTLNADSWALYCEIKAQEAFLIEYMNRENRKKVQNTPKRRRTVWEKARKWENDDD